MQTLSSFLESKIIDPEHLPARVAALRAEGLTIATLNGSFDILHAGHLEILFEASRQADRLIVALNSDASIKGYKSPKRPFVTLKDRLALMASLAFVSYVTWFDELNPILLLEKIKPNVHVNGAEYGENCIEAETVRNYGGRLHIVPLVPGLSTSNLIKKIQESI